jgi:hypothetical protein
LKIRTLRVATVKPLTKAVAAINASRSARGTEHVQPRAALRDGCGHGQNPTFKRRHDSGFDPSSQHRTLPFVPALQQEHAQLDLEDGNCRRE